MLLYTLSHIHISCWAVVQSGAGAVYERSARLRARMALAAHQSQ